MDKNLKKINGSSYYLIPGLRLAVAPALADGSDESKQNPTYQPHYHDISELVVITGGSAVQNIDGTDYPVVAGDVFLLQGNAVHYFKKCHKLCIYNILFDPDTLPLPWNLFKKIHGYNMIFSAEPNTRNPRNFENHLHLEPDLLSQAECIIRELQSALKERSDASEAESLGLLIKLIVFVSKHYAFHEKKDSELLPRISMILSMLEKNYTKTFTLEQLASMAYTSPRNFSRQFRRISGLSPINYLLRLRLRHAAELLSGNQNLSIAEIANTCGFNDSNYFSKMFMTHYRLSPRNYRIFSRK